MEKFEKIFSPINLIIINLAIIVSALATGSFYMDTGLIHVFALFFIALSMIRIFLRYYSYDQFLEKFFHAALATFIIFALSHFVEFLSYKILHLSDEVTFINITNFYIIGLLILTIGAERFLHVYQRRSALFIWVLSFMAIAFIVPIVGLYVEDNFVNLEPGALFFYVYIFISFAVAALAIWKVGHIGKVVSISTKFTQYMRWAIVFVTSAILLDLFYDLVKESLLENYQIIYISHFLFYGGMSLIFLAFGTLEDLKKTGLYSEAQRLKDQDELNSSMPVSTNSN